MRIPSVLVAVMFVFPSATSAEATEKKADSVDKWLEVYCPATGGVYHPEIGRCLRPGVSGEVDYTSASLEEYLAAYTAENPPIPEPNSTRDP